jgi:tripartite-type tricarboxylate transporter receptor subunit TctC
MKKSISIGRRSALIGTASIGVSLLVPGAGVYANDGWPTRPIRLVVPYSPGGALDALARIMAAKMSEILGQQIVVENKPGAAGNIGSAVVSQAAPDGYTLLCSAAGNFSINQFLYSEMPYVPDRDLAGVFVMGRTSHVVVTNKDLPIHSLKELAQYARDNPSRTNYGSAGVGTIGQLGFEAIKKGMGFNAEHIVYRGSGDVLMALLSGQVQVAMDVLPVYLPRIVDGSVRALAVGTGERSALLPAVPTVAEAGLPNFSVFTWWAVGAPAATPKDIVAKINTAGVKALAAPEVKEKFAALGADPVGGSVEETNKFLADETTKWRRFVDQAGVKL